MNLLERCLFLAAKDAPVFLSLFSFAPGAAGCVFGVGAGRPPRSPDREDVAGRRSCAGLFCSSQNSSRLILKEDFIWTAPRGLRRRRCLQTREAGGAQVRTWEASGSHLCLEEDPGTSCLPTSLSAHLPGRKNKKAKFLIKAAGEAPGRRERPLLPALCRGRGLTASEDNHRDEASFHQHPSLYRLSLQLTWES